MAEIVIVGGGVVGLGLGMMLARDEPPGHHSRAGRPAAPEDARGGLGQLGAPGRQPVPPAPPLPAAATARSSKRSCPRWPPPSSATAPVRVNPVLEAPDSITGGAAPRRRRVTTMLSGRRAVVERAVASVAEEHTRARGAPGRGRGGTARRRRGHRRGTPRDGRPHDRRRGATGRPGHRLRRPPLGAPGLAGGAGGAPSRGRGR